MCLKAWQLTPLRLKVWKSYGSTHLLKINICTYILEVNISAPNTSKSIYIPWSTYNLTAITPYCSDNELLDYEESSIILQAYVWPQIPNSLFQYTLIYTFHVQMLDWRQIWILGASNKISRAWESSIKSCFGLLIFSFGSPVQHLSNGCIILSQMASFISHKTAHLISLLQYSIAALSLPCKLIIYMPSIYTDIAGSRKIPLSQPIAQAREEIIAAAMYLYNQTLRALSNWKSPYELFHTYVFDKEEVSRLRKP